MTKTVKEIVAEIKTKMDQAGGLKHVYFVACGGSKAAIYPGLYLLQSEAKTFSATTYTSNEFVHATPKELDDRCVAVICSLKATAETVEAVKKANSIGAITIAMTGTATATALTPEMTLITECDFFENRYLRANSSERCGMGYCLRSLSISLMYSSESSR